ncbi:DAK2 domain-containing protein [uncultured Eubacterium sp.]|uniref:DAK2 domain-containing protein n=1 Tax=uncultured Eubacterium sp. TaxID=165185 RepID=UPI0025EED5F6|nr:DAK2 domain-containing protein [uncultured Eubacterium sp.]MDY5243350.1 DAK2 domain-containing protein [Eubacterium sp.]
MITGQMFRDGVISGANNIANSRQAVDALNIFPVPDGDTGTNMSMTIASAADEVKDLPDDVALCDVAKKTAGALLRGARGNSGVILSLIFRGFSKAFKGLEEAGGKDVARAFRAGTDAAYKAVMKPTEGTILTVVRCAAEAAENMAEINDDPMEVCVAALEAAKTALASTPELLPVLKQAGVVDAGGQGFLLVLQGMESVFGYNAIIRPVGEEAIADDKDLKAEENAQESTLSYSVKFTVYKNSKAKESDPIKLRAYLEAIGENVTVSEDGGKIKAQLCTDAPGNVITNALKYGQLYDITLENLREPIEEHSQEKQVSEVAEPINDYGFVSVCAGDGLTELFKDLGADSVVSGGQTMNPSTDDIVNAVLSVPAKVVYVLPNNKNIIMAAQMARDEIKDRKVAVLETKTIPQGISAMLAFDETVSVEENIETMTAQAGLTKTASVTFAARDSEVDGKPIKKGQMMGLCNGAIKFIGEDKEEIAFNSAAELFNPEENSLITVIYGKDETEENANKIEQMLIDKLGDDVEVSVVDGGQPVYYYIISVE